jgi:hypothetical protein
VVEHPDGLAHDRIVPDVGNLARFLVDMETDVVKLVAPARVAELMQVQRVRDRPGMRACGASRCAAQCETLPLADAGPKPSTGRCTSAERGIVSAPGRAT